MSMATSQQSTVEELTEKLLKSAGICHFPIDLEQIAHYLSIRWVYMDVDSMSDLVHKKIIIDNRLDWLDQREDFAHEIGHILLHYGSQLILPEYFIELQEWQANSFAMFLLIPSYLLISALNKLHLRTEREHIAYIAQAFHVSLKLAKKRFQKLQSQMLLKESPSDYLVTNKTYPRFGLDYDSTLTIGSTEYYYRNGGVVYRRKLSDF